MLLERYAPRRPQMTFFLQGTLRHTLPGLMSHILRHPSDVKGRTTLRASHRLRQGNYFITALRLQAAAIRPRHDGC